jgi:hypothetical protein
VITGVSREYTAPSSGLKHVGSEIVRLHREVTRMVVMRPKEKGKKGTHF